jgi:hypothetical protein
MCRWLMIAAIAAFALLVLAVAAVVKWGVEGLLLVILVASALAWLARALFPLLLSRLFMLPFRAKGAVLRGARVTVHSVELADTGESRAETVIDADTGTSYLVPAEGGNRENLDPSLSWYWVEATITPTGPTGPFTLWEPGELVLAGEKARSGSMTGLDEPGMIAQYRLWQDGRWTDDHVGKHGGEQRLRLLIGVPPGATRVRLRYYLEILAPIDLPPVINVRP